jgi:hypothetical protein
MGVVSAVPDRHWKRRYLEFDLARLHVPIFRTRRKHKNLNKRKIEILDALLVKVLPF